MRNKPVVHGVLAIALVALSAVASGCSGTSKPGEAGPAPTQEPGVKLGVTATPPAIAQPSDQGPAKPGGTGGTDEAHGDIQTASSGGGSQADNSQAAGKNVTASSDSTTPEDKATPPPVEGYTVKKPSLMGITLADTTASVTLRLGKPENEYTMEDETDPIVAYEYRGFIVGFSKAKLVQFVEITSGEVNPGLNGFKLGQSAKEAVDALGKPDASTKYALSYKSAGTILKLDVDPVSQNVLSIKLYADQKA